MIPGDAPEPLDGPPAATPGRGSLTGTYFCVGAGLALGIVAAFGGFFAFLIVILFGLVGLVVGRVLDGKLDLATLLGRSRVR